MECFGDDQYSSQISFLFQKVKKSSEIALLKVSNYILMAADKQIR